MKAGRIPSLNRDTHLLCGVVELSLFERSYLLLGMEKALVAYITETESMDRLLEAITDFNIELITQFHDAVGLDMVWYGDD